MGGCACPGAASGAAVHGGLSKHAGVGQLVPWLGAGLGAYGIYGSWQALSSGIDALTHLPRATAVVGLRHAEVAGLYADVVALPPAEAAAVAGHRALVEAELWGLERSLAELQQMGREQLFNCLVPGLVQGLASLAMTGAALGHLMGGSLAAAGAWLSPIGLGLFAIYAGCLALKHGLQGRAVVQTAPTAGSKDGPTLPTAFAAAVTRHAIDLQRSHRQTSAAWAAVGLSTAVGLGMLAFGVHHPLLWAGQSAIGLGTAGLAMWRNRHTRYSPHLPLGPHMRREMLQTAEQRATFYAQIQAQQVAAEAAAAELATVLGPSERLPYLLERLWAPLCGPRANQVLARSLAPGGGRTAAQRASQQATVQRAARAMCQAEVGLLAAWADAQATQLRDCVRQPLPESLDEFLREQLMAAEQRVRRQLRQTTDRQQIFTEAVAVLDDLDPSAAPSLWGEPAQIRWRRLELLLLQATGTLGEAVPAALLQRPEVQACLQHVPTYRGAPLQLAYPIDRLQVATRQRVNFAAAFDSSIDSAFVQVLGNVSRWQTELDWVLELHRQVGPVARKPQVRQAQCSSATCCSA
jgi:hypothetical protein